MLKELNKLTWGINTSKESIRKEDEFADIVIMYYNRRGALEVRRGTTNFSNSVGSKPFTSLFFFQNDETGDRYLIGFAWTSVYLYDEPNNEWDSLGWALEEFEIDWVTRTKWSFAVYKNVIYMCDGVNPYMWYDGTTLTKALTSGVAVTFDNTTDFITQAGHWYSNWQRILFVGSLPTEITTLKLYWIVNKTTDTYQISLTEWGSPVLFTTNGSITYSQIPSTPLFRYLQYMGDRVFGAWTDDTPNTLYYTSAAAANAQTITNLVVVGGDELGRINTIKELGSFICAGKTSKIYSINVSAPSSTPINSRSGIQSHRSVQNVEGSLLFFNEFWLDTLKQTSAISGTQALGTSILSENIRELFANIQPESYKTNCSLYAPLLNNYYFSFDANNLGTTDTTVVWSSSFGAFTRYNIPTLNDYCTYIDSDGEYRYLIAPNTGGQVLEFERWYNDNGVGIEWLCDYRTKFWTDDWKTISWVQIRGRKSVQKEATLDILIDGEVVSTCQISDDFIDTNSTPYPVWNSPIGTLPIGWGANMSDNIDTYEFSLRIPVEVTGQELGIRISSSETPLVFSLEQMRVEVNKEVISLFDNYA